MKSFTAWITRHENLKVLPTEWTTWNSGRRQHEWTKRRLLTLLWSRIRWPWQHLILIIFKILTRYVESSDNEDLIYWKYKLQEAWPQIIGELKDGGILLSDIWEINISYEWFILCPPTASTGMSSISPKWV